MASVLNPVSQESITHFMFKVFITWSYTLTPLIKNPKSPILQIFFLAPADTCKPALKTSKHYTALPMISTVVILLQGYFSIIYYIS